MPAIISNNPGKLRIDTGVIYAGEYLNGADPTYKMFWELAYGYRAMFKFLSYLQQQGHDTINAIAEYWTTNTPDVIVPFVASLTGQTGFLADQVIDLTNENVQFNIVEAISQYYNVIAAVLSDVQAGWDLFISTKLK